MLQAQAPGGNMPTPPSAPLHPSFTPPAQGGYKEAGEFTRMLETQSLDDGFAAPKPAAPQQRAQATGDATRAFMAQQAQAPGAPPAQQSGPSEFTKMFKAPPPAPPPPPEAKPVKKVAARPPIPKKKVNYVLWILIGLAVLLALVLIIYLIVK
jgi:hypothetical protein